MKSQINFFFALVIAFGLGTIDLQAATLDCSRSRGFVTNTQAPIGTADPSNPIKHVVIIMQENHSFDVNFGRLNVGSYGKSEVDGIDPAMHVPDEKSNPVYVYHSKTLCPDDPDHTWDALLA